MMNTRRTNLSQNNTHEEAESIGSEARIANLNQQLAQAQKNVENLLAQNVVLQAARLSAPSQHLEEEENSRNEDR
jgi:predicted transcriptional regulator